MISGFRMQPIGPSARGQQDHVLITTKSIGIPMKISVRFQCSHEERKHITVYSGLQCIVLIALLVINLPLSASRAETSSEVCLLSSP